MASPYLPLRDTEFSVQTLLDLYPYFRQAFEQDMEGGTVRHEKQNLMNETRAWLQHYGHFVE